MRRKSRRRCREKKEVSHFTGSGVFRAAKFLALFSREPDTLGSAVKSNEKNNAALLLAAHALYVT